MLNPENEELEERSEEQKEPKIPTRGIFVFRIDPNKLLRSLLRGF